MGFAKNIRFIFMISLIFILYFILIFIFYDNYKGSVEIIKSEYDAKHELVEKSVSNTIRHAYTMIGITEDQLSNEMKDKSLTLLEKYTKDPNVMSWNIEELKSQLGDCDIYIIDENLKVIRTTLKEDLGLDFSKLPAFSELLKSRIQGNRFIADRADISTNTGQLMKYSYMPTPDHKYILELSINLGERLRFINDLDIFSVPDQLTLQYPSVEKIDIYKTHFDSERVLRISKTKPYYSSIMDDKKRAQIQKAIKSNKVQFEKSTNESSENLLIHKYIPYVMNNKEGDFSWWNSYVIEVVYNDLIFKELNAQKIVFWKQVALITLVYLTFAFLILYLLLKSEHIAYHDPLTNLPNRKRLQEYVNQAIIGAKRSGLGLAILFLDLNKFKEINDNYGHEIGDKVLKEASARLSSNLRKYDMVSRLGGDEFIILLPNIKSEEDAIRVANKINKFFESPIIVNNHKHFIKFSIGISTFPKDGDQSDILMKKSDIAMYYAKKNQLDYIIYNESL